MVMCKCGIESVKGGLCRTHYIHTEEEIYLDNTDINDLGIIKWLGDMLPEHFRNAFPEEHAETYLSAIRLLDPRYTSKMHRLRELIAPRGFAKSKIIMGIISYICAHNGMIIKFKATDGILHEVKIDEKFIVIFSETGGMAEEFVINIRNEFEINEKLRYFYHYKIQDAKEADTGQWTKRAFKINGMYVLGLGEGQQSRGRIKGAYRITWAFYDDIYSENNTKTDTGRAGIKNWFYNSAQHSVDDLLGKSFLVGTIVHEDTVLVECEESKSWQTLKYYPMPQLKFDQFIKEHIKVDLDRASCALPFESEPDEFAMISKQIKYFDNLMDKEDMGIVWRERLGLYQLALKYKESVENSAIAGFYQEYFHLTVPTELKKFRREYFQEMKEWRIEYEFGYNWLYCEELFGDAPQMINIEMGIDIAGGKNEGDYTCISVAGVTPNGKGYVLEQSYGKYTMRDNISEDSPMYNRNDRILSDKSLVKKVGYIDEAFRMHLKYRPRIIKMGQGGGSENQSLMEMIRIFRANYSYTNIVPRAQTTRDGNKFERIKNTLLPRYETMSMYHANGLGQLEHELEFLGKTKNDDCSDALECNFFDIQRPVQLDYTFFTKKIPTRIPKLGYSHTSIEYDWRLPNN